MWWAGCGGAAGGVGDRRVLSGGIFLCTVEGCSEPPQQSTTFHGCHIKERGEKIKRKEKRKLERAVY